MPEAVFLSASVPDPKRSPQYAATADPVAITAAVSALVHATLGRRLLVWGGHPAITPMIWVVAEDMGIDYGSWVKLYQSRHFEDAFPEDNERFRNVIYTDDVARDRAKSLRAMRERMFTDHNFSAAVFVGGMSGVVEECELFRQLQPNAKVLPVASTGGAALELVRALPAVEQDLIDDLDYIALLYRHLDISVREQRYKRPEDQPDAILQRMWSPAGADRSATPAGPFGSPSEDADKGLIGARSQEGGDPGRGRKLYRRRAGNSLGETRARQRGHAVLTTARPAGRPIARGGTANPSSKESGSGSGRKATSANEKVSKGWMVTRAPGGMNRGVAQVSKSTAAAKKATVIASGNAAKVAAKKKATTRKGSRKKGARKA